MNESFDNQEIPLPLFMLFCADPRSHLYHYIDNQEIHLVPFVNSDQTPAPIFINWNNFLLSPKRHRRTLRLLKSLLPASIKLSVLFTSPRYQPTRETPSTGFRPRATPSLLDKLSTPASE